MSSTLIHYGVLGMKWGVRKDRTLSRRSAKAEKKAEIKRVKQEKKTASKHRGTMTDDELRARIQRLQLEKQLRELTEAEISPGRKFAKEILRESGKQALTQAAKNTMLYTGGELLGKKMQKSEFANAVFGGDHSRKESKTGSSNKGNQKSQEKQEQKTQKTYDREYQRQSKRNAKERARADANFDSAWDEFVRKNNRQARAGTSWEAYRETVNDEERRRRSRQRGLS